MPERSKTSASGRPANVLSPARYARQRHAPEEHAAGGVAVVADDDEPVHRRLEHEIVDVLLRARRAASSAFARFSSTQRRAPPCSSSSRVLASACDLRRAAVCACSSAPAGSSRTSLAEIRSLSTSVVELGAPHVELRGEQRRPCPRPPAPRGRPGVLMISCSASSELRLGLLERVLLLGRIELGDDVACLDRRAGRRAASGCAACRRRTARCSIADFDARSSPIGVHAQLERPARHARRRHERVVVGCGRRPPRGRASCAADDAATRDAATRTAHADAAVVASFACPAVRQPAGRHERDVIAGRERRLDGRPARGRGGRSRPAPRSNRVPRGDRRSGGPRTERSRADRHEQHVGDLADGDARRRALMPGRSRASGVRRSTCSRSKFFAGGQPDEKSTRASTEMSETVAWYSRSGTASTRTVAVCPTLSWPRSDSSMCDVEVHRRQIGQLENLRARPRRGRRSGTPAPGPSALLVR